MGSFIVNYQVRSGSLDAVSGVMEKMAASRASVSPSKNGWVTVYDAESDSQDDAVIRRIAGGLSRALKTDVLALLVHDSDIAVYWLYRAGTLLDEFNSSPDYFNDEIDDESRERVRGKSEALLQLCVPGTTIRQIEEVIHPTEQPAFAEEYLTQLASLLGIDQKRINLSFEYFENEGKLILDDASDFKSIGSNEE